MITRRSEAAETVKVKKKHDERRQVLRDTLKKSLSLLSNEKLSG
jgi:hypothetical protein